MSERMLLLKTWLLRNGAITPIDALEHLRIYRLAADIHRLRDAGWRIDNQTTDRAKLARYVLISAPHADAETHHG